MIVLGRVTVIIPDDLEDWLRRQCSREGYHGGAISKIVIKALMTYKEELDAKRSSLDI